MGVTERKFGELSTGQDVLIYHLENAFGAYVEVTELGAVLVKVCVPDRDGVLTDVVLGFDNVKQYEENPFFFGVVVGRNCNRIGGAKFNLFGKEIRLAANENGNNLHSGPDGFETKMWKATEISQEKQSVTFTRVSPDNENGFPGEFKVSVKYEFTDANELRIHYAGICDRDTVANMTNHSYFNLGGEGSGDVLDQFLTIHSKFYTPVDRESIPTGEYAPVEGTPMDFNHSKRIGQDIEADFEQLHFTGGYDHNYVTDNYAKGNCRLIASAYCQESGIVMDVASDCPCVQFYAGNFIQPPIKGKCGHTYTKRNGFCLETQVEPNAVNVENFHSPILEEGQLYSSVTTFAFRVK